MTGTIVVIGSINVDLVGFLERVPVAGETITGTDFRTFPGGKGANQAVGAARLGQSVRFIGRVGADHFGSAMIENLVANGVDTSLIRRLEGLPTGTALILVEASGENRIVVIPGANGVISPADIEAERQAIAEADYVLLQLEIPPETVCRAVAIASEEKTPVILDPAPARTLPDEVLRRVSVITPNRSELGILTGRASEPRGEEVAAAAMELVRRGVNTVVVKLGAEGVLIVDGHSVRPVPGFRVEVVDTTGAGDAFNAGLAAALSRGLDIEAACRFANAVGAMAVRSAGAQSSLPTWSDVERFLAEQGEKQ